MRKHCDVTLLTSTSLRPEPYATGKCRRRPKPAISQLCNRALELGTLFPPLPSRSMLVSEFPLIRPSRYVREKRKCWSQLSTGAYGSKWVFWLYRLIGSSQQKMIILMDIWGLKHNFFLLTVCTLDQYLKYGSEMLVSLPDSNAEVGPSLRALDGGAPNVACRF